MYKGVNRLTNSTKELEYLINSRAIRSSATLENVELPVIGIATELKREVAI